MGSLLARSSFLVLLCLAIGPQSHHCGLWAKSSSPFVAFVSLLALQPIGIMMRLIIGPLVGSQTTPGYQLEVGYQIFKKPKNKEKLQIITRGLVLE